MLEKTASCFCHNTCTPRCLAWELLYSAHTLICYLLLFSMFICRGCWIPASIQIKACEREKRSTGFTMRGVFVYLCVFLVCQWESNSACLCDGGWVGERWSTIVFSSKMGESFTLGAFLKAVGDFCIIVVFGIFYANAKHKLNGGGESKGTKCDWWAFQQTLAALFLSCKG